MYDCSILYPQYFHLEVWEHTAISHSIIFQIVLEVTSSTFLCLTSEGRPVGKVAPSHSPTTSPPHPTSPHPQSMSLKCYRLSPPDLLHACQTLFVGRDNMSGGVYIFCMSSAALKTSELFLAVGYRNGYWWWEAVTERTTYSLCLCVDEWMDGWRLHKTSQPLTFCAAVSSWQFAVAIDYTTVSGVVAGCR